MANRFPLIVNEVSRKIEELVAGDNLTLDGNNIVINGDTGAGKYITSDGSVASWGTPGDVYLTQSQTLLNKTFESCVLSGSVNTLTNIPNAALVNSGISINGVTIPLGGTVTTPDTDTTYTLTAVDGLSASQKLIRLSDSTTPNPVTTDVTLGVSVYSNPPAGSNPLSLELTRVNNSLTLSGYVTDNNTETFLIAAGGSAQSGTITFTGSGDVTLSMDDVTKTIDIRVDDQDTITEVRAGSGSTYKTKKITFLGGNLVTVGQATSGTDPDETEITLNSVDTVTRIRGGLTGTFLPATTAGADITITGGALGNTTVSQSGTTISIDSTDTNDVTRLATTNGALAFGDFRLAGSGATTVQATSAGGVTTFTFDSDNDDTGALLTASTGLVKQTYDFQLANAGNLTDAAVLKWDGVNTQLSSTIISDNGSTVTIDGNLVVNGTNTIVNTTQLQITDPTIELRRGVSLVDGTGGLQVNRTTDGNGAVLTYSTMQFYHSGNYWRIWDGSVAKRLVTEGESQVLSNKTLASPTFTGTAILGTATATSVNGLAITSTVNGTLGVTSQKTFNVEESITLQADDTNGSVTVNFDTGGAAGSRVIYSSDNLGAFAPTTSGQIQAIMTDATGVGGNLMFSQAPVISTSISTPSQSFSLINNTATLVNFAGSAVTLNIGNTGGTTTVEGSLVSVKNATLGTDATNTLLINSTVNIENADLTIRGTDSHPMTIGRGGQAIETNTIVGHGVLSVNSTGALNTAMGYDALESNLSGTGNVAFGRNAGKENTGGDYNIYLGYNAGQLNTIGGNNVNVGAQTGYTNLVGNNNVFIGHYAGFGCTGSGNVLIGPADTEDDTSATYQPNSPGGTKQLVIGSGDTTWVTGIATGEVTIPNDFRVGGVTTLSGDLIVEGSTVTVDSRVLTIDDKTLELASVALTSFSGTLNNTDTVTNVASTTGLIVGMEVTTQAGGVVIPAGTSISAISGSTVTLSNAIAGSGVATLIADGPTDLGAQGGGLVVKGTVDKTILYDGLGVDPFWVFSENLKLPNTGFINIGTSLLLGPTTLGTSVVNSSLTSVGTLTSLDVAGNVSIGGRTKESCVNQFTTPLTPVSNVLTISVAGTNTILGTTANAPITTWDFTNVNIQNNEALTVTLIIAGNTGATYGDACNVDGVSIGNGVQWSGGSPPLPTPNTDILTFIFVRDSGGTTKVFGQGNTNFS